MRWRRGAGAATGLAALGAAGCTAEQEREFEEAMEALAIVFLFIAAVFAVVIGIAVWLLVSGLAKRRRAAEAAEAEAATGREPGAVAEARRSEGTGRIVAGGVLLGWLLLPAPLFAVAAGGGVGLYVWRRQDERLARLDERERLLLAAASGVGAAAVFFTVAGGPTLTVG